MDQPPAITIQYTADVGGIYGGRLSLNEANALVDPSTRGDLRLGNAGFELDVLMHGAWSVWAPAAPGAPLPAPDRARGWFGAGGIALGGPGAPVAVLRSDTTTLAQPPEEGPGWLVPWLEEASRKDGRPSRLRRGTGRWWNAKGADGSPLVVLSRDGSVPPPAVLRDAGRWLWGMRATMPVVRGRRTSTLAGVVEREGGGAVRTWAQAHRAPGALAIDLGNAVGRVLDEEGAPAMNDTMAAVLAAKLDALVPDDGELRLARPDWERLAAAVPLIACNLVPPPGVAPPRAYVLAERGGIKVAIVGLADTDRLRRLGLVGGRTKWQAEPAAEALARACKEAREDGARTIVVATAMGMRGLSALPMRPVGVLAYLTSEQRHDGPGFREVVAPPDPARDAAEKPWLVSGVSLTAVGELNIRYTRDGLPAAIAHTVTRIPESSAPDVARSWRGYGYRFDRMASLVELLLPDSRDVVPPEPPAPGEPPEPVLQYDQIHRARLGAGLLRDAAGAEVGLLDRVTSGSNTVGTVPASIVATWYGSGDRTGTITLTGAQLQALLAADPEGERWSLAGLDPQARMVAGRPLVPEERYRVATREDLATGEAIARLYDTPEDIRFEPLPGPPRTVSDVVLAGLAALKRRHGGLGPAMATDLRPLLQDDGKLVQPRWTLAMRPLEGSYQRFAVQNRDPFAAVRNAQVNLPDNTDINVRGQAALTYEAPDLDWESKARIGYQRVELALPTEQVVQEQADNVMLGSELRLKFISLQTGGAQAPGTALVPYVGAIYQTEFTPTDNAQTKLPNPLRRELNGTLGAVLRPGGLVQEIRLGALLEQDFAVTRGGTEPGMQLAAILQQRLGPATLRIEGDLKNYFLTQEDTPDDLSTLAQLDVGISVPVWGAVAFRVGVLGLAFMGKVPETRTWGTALTPSIGLTVNTTWKPLTGVVF